MSDLICNDPLPPNEERISLASAAKLFAIDGKTPHKCLLWRLAKNGKRVRNRVVRLAVEQQPRGLVTTAEACRRFFSTCTALAMGSAVGVADEPVAAHASSDRKNRARKQAELSRAGWE